MSKLKPIEQLTEDIREGNLVSGDSVRIKLERNNEYLGYFYKCDKEQCPIFMSTFPKKFQLMFLIGGQLMSGNFLSIAKGYEILERPKKYRRIKSKPLKTPNS